MNDPDNEEIFRELGVAAFSTTRIIAGLIEQKAGLILMTNGEWMVYRSICRKENFWVRDLFLGRASDGRWYYSTYHFCINMCALGRMGEGQPSSLADFAQTYYLKPFDGRSDECLQSTWPPRRMTER